MGETARWGGHVFKVSADTIRSFSGLRFSASAETEDKIINVGGTDLKYTAWKYNKPVEVSFTVYLNAMAGCNVRQEADSYLGEAQWGKADFLYIGNQRITPDMMMLTNASINEIRMASNGTWTNAEVQLTFKQCAAGNNRADNSKSTTNSGSSGGGSGSSYSGGGGSSSGSGSGSVKASVKSSTPTVSPSIMAINKLMPNADPLANKKKTVAANTAVVNKNIAAAKAISANKKRTTGVSTNGKTLNVALRTRA